METTETIKRSYNLKNLYLDPNNYRFVDNDNYIKVDDTKLLDERVQRRTRSFIEGNKRENIRDLISSFKSNGFLDVDVIQVRDFGNNNYLVIEGNRRVTALKGLQEDYERGLDIGNLNPEIFRKIPFEIEKNEDREKYFIKRLKLINGSKKWSALSQAKFIYDYLKPYWGREEYAEKEQELCSSLGITKVRLRASQRAYHMILDYKKSDYGEQFESSDYSIFEEITKRPTIKEWLEWDDSQYVAQNIFNQERLFSWISKTSDLVDEEYIDQEAIITKSIEIQDLAIFIQNENAIEEMEKTRSVSRGLVSSGELEKQNYEKSLNATIDGLDQLLSYKDIIPLEKLNLLNTSLEKLIPKKSLLEMTNSNYSICFEHNNSIKHFSSIVINQYKIFNNFTMDNLNKINIFAGNNNSGKTSLLEAIYFLTKQNDIVSFLEIIKLKNKLKSLNPVWLNRVFGEDERIEITGLFHNTTTTISFHKFEANDIDKKDDYIASYKLKSTINDRQLDNTIHTFGYSTIQRKNEKVEHLCNSIFKSPYFYNIEEIVQTYNKNTQYKTNDGTTAIHLVIEFIKKIDPTINDIRLNDVNDIERFIVDSTRFSDKNLEITNYGEGIQRVFEVALAFAYSRNGIVCIDEFETAIHYSLLIDFTKFIQELAETFNVQVFITTHSKESIDAFVNNGYKNDDISFFTMIKDADDQIQTIHYDDEALINELSQNLEVRGW